MVNFNYRLFTKHWPVILLCIIFFSLSIWNLGSRHLPATTWKPQNGSADFYLQLERERLIDSLSIFVVDDRQVNLEVYSGNPDFWSSAGEIKVSGTWKQWQQVALNSNTRYLRLTFRDSSAEIGEIVIFSAGKPVPVQKLIPLRYENSLESLIDEPSVLTNIPSFKNQSYFDEVYFARAADEYLNNKVPFEWSHPPLSKLIISTGVILFGSGPFAWRITGVVVAVFTILLVYVTGLRMFGSRGAWIAALLISFDFMHFAESRLATAETFIFFFIVLIFLFFFRYYQDPDKGPLFLFLSLAAFGLGFATKWLTANSLAGLSILLLIVRGKKIFQSRDLMALILGSVAAVFIYFLSFIPDILVGRSLKELLPLQWSMYQYHATLKEGHPFSAPWWGWPIMFRPLWFYSGQIGNKLSEIVLLGNPALWWGSIPALAYLGWLAIRRDDKVALFILVPYLTQWLFFIPINRVLFIYHFYPNVLFMTLATAYCLQRFWTKHKYWCMAYLGLNLASFIVFFPLISGLPVPQGYWELFRDLVILPK